MPAFRVSSRLPSRWLLVDVDADHVRIEGPHRVVLARWTVVVFDPRLVVVRRVDLREALVEPLCPGAASLWAMVRRM